MNSYFDDLYNDVYEYAYDTIKKKRKNTPKRGWGKTKNINPKIKKKIKHKKWLLLLLISEMITVYIFLLKSLDEWDRYDYNDEIYQLNTGSYKQGNSAYNRIKTKYNVTDNTITRDYCKEMIKKLKKDKEKINELDDFKSLKALLDIEKRLKNPITRLLDSKVLTAGMKRKIGDAWGAINISRINYAEE